MISARRAARSGMLWLALAAGMAGAPPANADQRECQAARARYNKAVGQVRGAWGPYTNCLGRGGHEPCSSEWEALRLGNREFELAVGDLQFYCR
jgi:hypothetical protein